MSESGDDAQRTLEKKALRNVRNLVDKIEADERDKPAHQGKLILRVVVVTALVFALLVGFYVLRKSFRGPPAQPVASAPTAQMSSAQYVEQALAKIERIANTRHQPDLAGFSGRVRLAIAIGPNGYTKSIAVTQSSWNAGLDGAVTKIVKLSEPFGALPDEIRKSSEAFDITRTFRVDPLSGTSRGALSIERAP